MKWLEGLCHSKVPVEPGGIEPATFRFVAQCREKYIVKSNSEFVNLKYNLKNMNFPGFNMGFCINFQVVYSEYS
jgi:hypothetical protein